jgi:hypothetical protein
MWDDITCDMSLWWNKVSFFSHQLIGEKFQFTNQFEQPFQFLVQQKQFLVE